MSFNLALKYSTQTFVGEAKELRFLCCFRFFSLSFLADYRRRRRLGLRIIVIIGTKHSPLNLLGLTKQRHFVDTALTQQSILRIIDQYDNNNLLWLMYIQKFNPNSSFWNFHSVGYVFMTWHPKVLTVENSILLSKNQLNFSFLKSFNFILIIEFWL